MTPDPYKANNGASGDPAEPQSWNRYAYAGNDPINFNDPSGLAKCIAVSVATDSNGQSTAEIQCLSAAGSILDYQYASFSGNGLAQALSDATATLGANLDRNERANFQALLEAAVARVQDDLLKKDCAKDFRDAAKSSAKAATIGFSNQGFLQYTGSTAARRSPGVARYNRFTGSINLNSTVNWANPNVTLAVINGNGPNYFGIAPDGTAQTTQVDLLAGQAAALGVASVTAAQYMDLTILHELSHYNGVIGNPDRNPGVEIALWNDCIK